MKKRAAKSGKAKPSGKRAAVKDLSAKKAAAVKGGTENVSLNFAKASVEYRQQ